MYSFNSIIFVFLIVFLSTKAQTNYCSVTDTLDFSINPNSCDPLAISCTAGFEIKVLFATFGIPLFKTSDCSIVQDGCASTSISSTLTSGTRQACDGLSSCFIVLGRESYFTCTNANVEMPIDPCPSIRKKYGVVWTCLPYPTQSSSPSAKATLSTSGTGSFSASSTGTASGSGSNTPASTYTTIATSIPTRSTSSTSSTSVTSIPTSSPTISSSSTSSTSATNIPTRSTSSTSSTSVTSIPTSSPTITSSSTGSASATSTGSATRVSVSPTPTPNKWISVFLNIKGKDPTAITSDVPFICAVRDVFSKLASVPIVHVRLLGIKTDSGIFYPILASQVDGTCNTNYRLLSIEQTTPYPYDNNNRYLQATVSLTVEVSIDVSRSNLTLSSINKERYVRTEIESTFQNPSIMDTLFISVTTKACIAQGINSNYCPNPPSLVLSMQKFTSTDSICVSSPTETNSIPTIIGIVVGVVNGICILVVLLYSCNCCKKSQVSKTRIAQDTHSLVVRHIHVSPAPSVPIIEDTDPALRNIVKRPDGPDPS